MSKGDNFANGALVTRAGNAKKSSEELNGISESAQEQHEMELQALFDQLELEEGEEVQFPYLVRGAELYCNCGTHKRRLNLPICHGVYTNGKPMMHEEDCEVGDDKNIPSFGICQSEENPVNKSWLAKAGDKIKGFFTGEQEEDDDAEKIIDNISKNGLKPQYILVTHGHTDHILANRGWTECKRISVYTLYCWNMERRI